MSNEKKDDKYERALAYHEEGRPGKIEVRATKPCMTARDLSLAYTPGVAAPCLAIAEEVDKVYRYTSKGNLVAVISNGSAVLGLGDIGPEASKPVMEGKGVLFKSFADVDVFDIEIKAQTVEEMVQIVSALEPTFGGINLEDIKSPECFEVERILREKMDIPVFHDDQHGTAIIATAGFINALEVTKRKPEKTKVVFTGAGAASIACANLMMSLGLKPENVIMTDSHGVVYKGRKEGMNKYKEAYARETQLRTLEEAIKGADAFIGCSAKGVLSKEMVKSMNKRPIIFAMANPEPEIFPEDVLEVRKDAIMATGRTDYPNQINNVLGFPFIFRGALDVKAKKINEEMKLAASQALANLAKEDVPDEVKAAYENQDFTFGPNYLIPKPFDKRVLTRVAPAVAQAAIESGVARESIDLKDYVQKLEERLGNAASFINSIRDRLNKSKTTRIVFAEGQNGRILQAVSILQEDKLVTPVLLGNATKIQKKVKELNLKNMDQVEIILPEEHPKFKQFVQHYYVSRQRKGVTKQYAKEVVRNKNYFASMLLKEGEVDGMITGATQTYPECVRPIMSVIGTQNHRIAAGIIILVFKNRVLFLADCTMNISPDAEQLCNIARSTASAYRSLMLREPKVAFLSFSNFGSNRHPSATKVSKAVELIKAAEPMLVCDGELQADVAVNRNILQQKFPFSTLNDAADILIFPDLAAANISYKLLSQLSEASPIGPLLVPMQKSVNIVQMTSNVNEIVNMAILTSLEAQLKKGESSGKSKKHN